MNDCRILIAVSHPPLGAYLRDVARSLGYEASVAHSWSEAVAHARRGGHPIVLLDERLKPAGAGSPYDSLRTAGRELAVILLESRFPAKRTRPGPEWVLREPDRPAAIRQVLNAAIATLVPAESQPVPRNEFVQA